MITPDQHIDGTAHCGTLVIGLGGLEVVRAASGTLVTYALGSCIGVTIHDPIAHVGGMVHLQMANSRDASDPHEAQSTPGRYVDLGLPLLLATAGRHGASPSRLRIVIAGGAAPGHSGSDFFAIGKRNLTAVRKLLWQSGLLLAGEDVGGDQPRTMKLDMSTGETVISTQGRQYLI
jgi:chemotaxis protein CheD